MRKYWFAKNLRKPNSRNYLFCLHEGVFKLAWRVRGRAATCISIVKNQNGTPPRIGCALSDGPNQLESTP
jgi:hypothetical protein